MKGLETQSDCPGTKGVLAQCGAGPPGGEMDRTLALGGTERDRSHRTYIRLSSRNGMTEARPQVCLALDTLWLPPAFSEGLP